MAESEEIGIEGLKDDLELEILLYLYNHPTGEHGTTSLAFNLRAPSLEPGQLPRFDEAYTQKQQQDILEVQHAIESLILAQCVEGVRAELGSSIQFNELKLTHKGEEEAIRAKRHLKELPTEA